MDYVFGLVLTSLLIQVSVTNLELLSTTASLSIFAIETVVNDCYCNLQ